MQEKRYIYAADENIFNQSAYRIIL